MPISAWNVHELVVGAVELPDTLLVTGELHTDETDVDPEAHRSDILDVRLFLRDRQSPDVQVPVVDAALRKASRQPWWPFRNGARFLFRCQVRRALDSVELDMVEEIAFQFPLFHDESWISLDWDAP